MTKFFLALACAVAVLAPALTLPAQSPKNFNEMSSEERQQLWQEYQRLKAENAQLAMQVTQLQEELDKLKGRDSGAEEPGGGEGLPMEPEPDSDKYIITIERIEPYKRDNTHDLKVMNELREEVRTNKTELEKKKARLNKLREENRRAENTWRSRPPWWRRDNRFVKPHSDAELGSVNLDIMKLEGAIKKADSRIKRMERAQTELCYIVIGAGPHPNGEGENGVAPHRYHVICSGSFAKRIQKNKTGDIIEVRGDVVESDPSTTRLETTFLENSND